MGIGETAIDPSDRMQYPSEVRAISIVTQLFGISRVSAHSLREIYFCRTRSNGIYPESPHLKNTCLDGENMNGHRRRSFVAVSEAGLCGLTECVGISALLAKQVFRDIRGMVQLVLILWSCVFLP